MAVVSGVSRTTLARVEAGGGAVPVETIERLLAPAGWVLVVVEQPAGEEADRVVFVPPLREWGGSCRDGAGRRYPAHLPLVVDPLPGEWWAPFGLIRPPETFYRSELLRRPAQRVAVERAPRHARAAMAAGASPVVASGSPRPGRARNTQPALPH